MHHPFMIKKNKTKNNKKNPNKLIVEENFLNQTKNIDKTRSKHPSYSLNCKN